MLRCRVIDILFRLCPLAKWSDFLIRHHVEICSACRVKLASKEEARFLFIQGPEAGNLDRLWPAIATRISRQEVRTEREMKKPAVRPGFRLAAAALILAGITALWLIRDFSPGPISEVEEPSGRFQVNYINVENEPARAVIFTPWDSHVIIIWAGKSL